MAKKGAEKKVSETKKEEKVTETKEEKISETEVKADGSVN